MLFPTSWSRQASSVAEPLSLGQLGRVLLRYWVLIVAGTLLGAVLAFGATRLMTPVYRATATQLVKGQPGTGSAPSYEAAQYAVSRAKTYPSFVYNAGVLESVQEDLGGSRTIEQLRLDLTASNPVGTPLLEITAAGTTPREASEKANSAAKHLALFITKIESVNGKTPISVELAVQAALPLEAASPKTLVITALGALIGFALATIAALLNSYLRYQRRSAFRRRQAMNWMNSDDRDEAAGSPTPAPAPAAAAVAGQVDVGTGPAAAAAGPPPESQPALVEAADTELVKVTAGTRQPPHQGPVVVGPATRDPDPVVAGGEDRRDTVNLRLSELTAAPGPGGNNGSSDGRPVSGMPAPSVEAVEAVEAVEDTRTGLGEDLAETVAPVHGSPAAAAAPDVVAPNVTTPDAATTDTAAGDLPTHPAGKVPAADVVVPADEEENEIPIDGDATVLITLPSAEVVERVEAVDGEDARELAEHPDGSKEPVAR